MKAIKEKARRFAKQQVTSDNRDNYSDEGSLMAGECDSYTSYLEGYKEAQRDAYAWVLKDVEPEPAVPLLLRDEECSSYTDYRVGWYLFHKYRGYGFYTYPEPGVEFLVTDFTHWRYISMGNAV